MWVRRVLLGTASSAVLLAACGAPIRGDSPRVVTNPLDDRTTAVRSTPRPPVPGSLLADPQPAGPGGTSEMEGASVRAVEYFAETFGVPAKDLRVHSVGERPDGEGWRVTVSDPFRNPHTLDVTAAALTWIGQTREEGVLVAQDEGQRVIVVQANGRALTLRLSASGDARASGIVPGTRVAVAYDASARGDGTLLLASLQVLP